MTEARARMTDPITSHRAADRMNIGDRLTRDEEYALYWITRNPGCTAKQLERLAVDTEGKIHRRVKGLFNKKKIRKVYDDNCREARLYPVYKDRLF